ncbi:MAG: alpha/beta fold hydrolase [Actinomycetota bacterium]|nr:alpha/beta fold hydrolase [Actinomycetota bacterium]
MLAERDVAIRADGVKLPGSLAFPFPCNAVVLFAHGSGSSRHSPRNRFVATKLQEAGLGTLLFDLLTADEEQTDLRTSALRFDIGMLARRLVGIIDWLTTQPDTQGLPIGLFGASTGAAGALIAAAERPDEVAAVVSRGGRPDLAGPSLARVQAPTLLIVGGADAEVLELNRHAQHQLPSSTETQLEIVPGASHLFEEPGALEQVAELASDFFARHLAL